MARGKKSRRPAGRRRQSPAPTSRLSELDRLIADRDWLAADRLLDDLERHRPRDVDLLARRMEVALRLGDTLKHQAACEGLLRITPDDPDLLLVLAGLYFSRVRP